MPSELHRYQEKLKLDLTREGAKNLILISRKWRGRTGMISRRALGSILSDLAPDEEKEGPNGRIERRWFIHRVIKHINSKKGGNGGLNLDAERARLAKLQADAQEIKNALARGEIISTEEATAGVGKVASAIVQILESIPIRLKRANPALTQSDLDIVRAEICKARNECAVLLP